MNQELMHLGSWLEIQQQQKQKRTLAMTEVRKDSIKQARRSAKHSPFFDYQKRPILIIVITVLPIAFDLVGKSYARSCIITIYFTLAVLSFPYMACIATQNYIYFQMRMAPKTSLSHRRPNTTPNRLEPAKTYKYLTLSPESNSNLTPYFPGVTRIMNKIGSSKRNSMFEPAAHQKRNYSTKRYKQLQQQFTRRGKDKFEFEIDEIVLGCYDYAQPHGRRSVWRHYRNQVDDLSYEVMRMRQNSRGGGFN